MHFVVIVIAACTSAREYKRYTGGRPCNRLWEIIIVPRRTRRRGQPAPRLPSTAYLSRLNTEKDVRRRLPPGGTQCLGCVFFLSLLICIHFGPTYRKVVPPLNLFLDVLLQFFVAIVRFVLHSIGTRIEHLSILSLRLKSSTILSRCVNICSFIIPVSIFCGSWRAFHGGEKISLGLRGTWTFLQ